MVKILHLTLKKEWFDLIASGKKKFEYREIKLYWTNRLFKKEHPNRLRNYDYIVFRNGYRVDSPRLNVEYLGLSIKKFNGKNHYALHLGKVFK